MKTKFFHVRYRATNGETNPHGGITYAFYEEDGYVKYAKARCSMRDNFNKKYGRAKAAGRLRSDIHRMSFRGSVKDFIQYIGPIVGLDRNSF